MKRHLKVTSILFIFLALALSSCKKEYRLFAGGFTEKEGDKGLSVFDFNSKTGELKLISQADVGPSPSYFCYSPRNKMFYFLNEVMKFRGQSGGGVSTFKYDKKDGSFTKQNEILIPYGGPCFISMSPDSGYLFTANYPNGSVAVVKLDSGGIPVAVTDTVLYDKAEPDASHAHMILNDPSGNHIYVTDLGLDRIIFYNFNTETGRLIMPANGMALVPRGSGPRHFTFNSDGSKLYVINELGSTMMVFNAGKEGLTLKQTLPTVREGFDMDNACADVHISSDGKFLYGSNRGENTIVTYRIGADGLLTHAGNVSCGGEWPRNFVIDPTGKFILVGNQKSDEIAVLRIDRKTGLPDQVVNKITVKSPVCLKFY